MIYLKNNTETQAIYIPRQTVLGSGYIATTEKYEEGYNDGFEDGKEQQKEKLSSLHVAENGQYEREDGWNVVTVDVPDLNGSYDEGYAEGERMGYEQGKTDGVNEQKGKLESINITENGTYRKEDGYSEVVVNVPDLNGDYNEGYAQGKIDGIDEQKSKLESISITENGVFSKEDGYNHIEVNVPDLNGSYDEGYEQGHTEGYNEGKTDGVNEQKGKLSQIRITENGTYAKEDGYSEVVVDVPDLNGSYDEGYTQGKIDGANEQKSKLETISITENGVYSKEDGYNEIVVEVPGSSGDYNEGYKQGQADIAANARVFNVTENGQYMSKFSDPIVPELVTGVYADGTDFHNYAELNRKVFNTKIAATINSRLEFWYKGDNTLLSNPTYNLIIGAGNNDDRNCFQVRYNRNNRSLYVDIGKSRKLVKNWDNTVWHHFIVSKAEGLWIDGEKKGDFTASNTINGEFFINGIGYDTAKNANGTFGMIKIDDVVIIPTADGFQNVNTGELLEVVQNGTYTFTENLPIYGEGELYKTINVNVIAKINLQKEGIKLAYGKFTEVPEWADFEGITDMSNMFGYCSNLQTIPLIDTSNVTNMSNMFGYCSNLQTIPLLNTSNVTDMSYMFHNCSSLKTIPLIDTSNVTNMGSMFEDCPNLQTIPEIDTSNVTNMNSMFYRDNGIKTLVSLPKFNCQKVTDMRNYFSSIIDGTSTEGMSALTDVGGWENLKCNWNDNYGLIKCLNLTYQSCINVLNGLYDFVAAGETPSSSQGKLKVHQNFLDTVGEEISIGTNKGWTITA